MAALAVGAGLAGPVTGQPAAPADTPTAAPKSLLPDEFDVPARPAPVAPLLPGTDAPTVVAPPPPPLLTGPVADASDTTALTDPMAPPATGRDITVIGPLTTAAGGYGVGTFVGSRGRFLAGLANRIDAPIGSRWAAIALNRALLSESAAPSDIRPADWVAVRAWLLTRMGEVEGAKRLVDSVPVDRYSPALYRVAGQVALAAGDISGLCPIAGNGQLLSRDVMWDLAVGMCAALQGDDITAARLFDALAEDEKRVEPFDVRLGERVATIAGGAGRAANIDWAEAPRLTPFRYAVATATGISVPANKLAGLGRARFGWLVRNAGIGAETRLESLGQAAVLGTMSATELVSGVAALAPADAPGDSRAGRLRTAFAGGSLGNRRDALAAIMASGDGSTRYAALLEAATAAARLPVTADSADASADIIAALLGAGDTRAALRWWPIADKAAAPVRARAWALLATGTGGVPIDADAFESWRSDTSATDHQAAMLLAGLAGLGLASGADWEDARGELLPATANSWTRAIDAAAAGRRAGEAIILSATGLQGAWKDVPPQHLYHVVAALNRVGRPLEARLVAAEAVTRS
ncbi:hypothetical protein GGQ62_002138 [Polymorphobacter fuscus]|nr:hypothetical protein [Polymorphobacter fuscus]